MVTADERITIDEAADAAKSILSEVGRAVVGKDDALELLLMALLADGHVLIEDFPGLAKTLMARSFAVATGLDFARVQFTPDQLPMDITGAAILDPAGGDFVFRPGPIFTNLLLADEINRAPAKTQAALLEAMQERQVTIDGVSHPTPFRDRSSSSPPRIPSSSRAPIRCLKPSSTGSLFASGSATRRRRQSGRSSATGPSAAPTKWNSAR